MKNFLLCRAIGVVFVFSIPVTAVNASPGMAQYFAYLCNPDVLTERAVNICVEKFPTLSGAGTSSLAEWRKRNKATAIAAVEQCRAEGEEFLLTATKAETLQFQQGFKKLEDEWVAGFAESVKKEGVVRCKNVFLEMNDTRSDLSSHPKIDSPAVENSPLQIKRNKK